MRKAVMCIGCGAAFALLVATGGAESAARSAAGTALYCGSRHVASFVYGYEVQDLTGVGLGSVTRHGDILRAVDDASPFANGYARIRSGGIWYVNAFGKRVTTIGTVRRETDKRWGLYLGLGQRARRVGFARGADAPYGAVGLLLIDGVGCEH
jgi:hypothetical protein